MGRTNPSATVLLMQEEANFSRFRLALRRSDQLALDDLFTAARQHVAAAQYASHALPFEVNMLAMLLEEHKAVMKLRNQLDDLSARLPKDPPGGDQTPSIKAPGTGFIDPGFGVDDDPMLGGEERDE